jgi:hypothetical protein
MKITRQGRYAVINLEGLTRATLTSSELREKARQMLALADVIESLPMTTPQFDSVGCSQCGRSFGPGDNGFSHCKDHISVGWD